MIFGPSPSKADFDATDWQQVIASSTRKSCEVYDLAFFKKATEAEQLGNNVQFEVFKSLGAVATLRINNDSPDENLRPTASFSSGARTANDQDFTDNHLAVFRELLAEVKDPEMRARIGDLLWIRKRNFEAAEAAVIAYMDAGRAFISADEEVPAAERFERAIHLSASLGRNNPILQKTLDDVLVCSPKMAPSDMRVFNRPLWPERTPVTLHTSHGPAGNN